MAVCSPVARQTIVVAGDRIAKGRALLTKSRATIVKVAKLAVCARAAIGVTRRQSDALIAGSRYRRYSRRVRRRAGRRRRDLRRRGRRRGSRALIANDARVLVVAAVLIAPAVERALPERILIAGTTNVIHPYRVATLTKGCAAARLQGIYPEELLADHVRIVQVPGIVADCAPLAIMQDLDATFTFSTASDQAKRAVGRRCGRRRRRGRWRRRRWCKCRRHSCRRNRRGRCRNRRRERLAKEAAARAALEARREILVVVVTAF